jgi:hypothetical protein
MPVRRSTKATRPDDKRLKANLPAERRAAPRQKSRYELLVEGELTVADLDDEEIRRGQTRNKDGGFSGRPPKAFPRALHDALRLEFQRRMNQKFQVAVDVAYITLLEVANNPRASADARVKAATALMERGLGKVPDKVFAEVAVKKFEENIEGLFVDVPEVVQGQVVSINRKDKSA